MPLTPEEFDQLTETFDYNDQDKDGGIGFDEFANMLRDLEADMEPEDVRLGFRVIDTDHDGVIALDEFIEWWSGR